MRQASIFVAALGMMALTACGGPGEEVAEPTPVEPAADDRAVVSLSQQDLIDASIAHPARPDADRERDPFRKPAEVLALTSIGPGMTIVDMEAGGGYYTEIMSRIVGPGGKLIMQNPQEMERFVGAGIEARMAEERLPNVVNSRTPFYALDVEDGAADLVTWLLGAHEIWFEIDGQSLGTPEAIFADIARAVKPGGEVLLADHIAHESAGEEAGGTLHRIAPEIVRGYAEAAGLELVTDSDVLRNDEDPLDDSPFGEGRRGRTSRFVHIYKKPE